ncbi:MAG TPA: BamA/TamA family outer membrane protein [Woeseiaceae bacterium]|nr:BamA/TamA family outer membrane protein [Woeseiaceae bacterium]
MPAIHDAGHQSRRLPPITMHCRRNVKAPRRRRRLCAYLLVLTAPAAADVTFEVQGVEDPLLQNIVNHNNVLRMGRPADISDEELDEIAEEARTRTREALQPYGYYHPVVRSRHSRNDAGEPVVQLTVDPGPPVVIRTVDFEVAGPGASQRELSRWRRDWPLGPGGRLDQVTWEEQKQAGLDIAREGGYLGASYTAHRLALDLERNTADLTLHMETGPRYVVGDVTYSDHVLRPEIVEEIPRFEAGDPYSSQLLDDFRLDLWRTGYFTEVDVVANTRPDAEPPAVDLRVELATETRNRYQGALGYGTDTGIRLQANWSRHPMSSRGDRVDVAAGWQDVNNEFAIRGTYRRPLVRRVREFWVVDAKISFENQDLEVKRTDEDENFLTIANGNVDERHVKAGWLKLLNAEAGEKQTSLQPFVQYLSSERSYDPVEPVDVVLAGDREFEQLLRGTDNALSVGLNYDVIAIVGQSFETRGYHDQAWVFASSKALGSDTEFTQAYVSTRRSWLRGQRWKYLLRAELGYTDAAVDTVDVAIDGVPLELSVTQLPNFYRFKAGGSASVRGYDFEQLSNNNIGSNNVITASAEIEYRITNKWSAAAFADIGNAFNDWSDTDLKLGVGVGVRWYSIAGPIRLDVAQARDFTGQPWRVHLTIGTPLL